MYTPRSSIRLSNACRKCLRQQRSRPYSSQPTSPPPPPPIAGAAKLTTRRLISLHGPEAPKFLQGIITNNLRSDSRTGFYAAFLTAPGKVLNDVFVYPTLGSKWHAETHKSEDQGYLVEVDADDATALFKHVKRHKLRAKLALRMLDEGELDVWNAWRDDEPWTAHSQGANEDGTISLTDCRAPGMGQRILLPSSSSGSGVVGNTAALEGLEEAPLSAYTIRRYLRGVAEGQKEIPREETLPMNANIDLMNGIDFKRAAILDKSSRSGHTTLASCEGAYCLSRFMMRLLGRLRSSNMTAHLHLNRLSATRKSGRTTEENDPQANSLQASATSVLVCADWNR